MRALETGRVVPLAPAVDPVHVEQVVDEPHELAQLPIDQVAR